jgi:glycosyltransferase involved in cell wall biosynthesis
MNISVVIPTYNRADHILNAINSVKNQTYQANEIIVVDDGSSDNTKELLKDQNIKYIYQKNQGVSAARNTGIKKSSNNWIAFLDSDDIWLEDKLKYQVDFHKKNKDIKISHTDEIWINNGKLINKKHHQSKPFGWCFLDNISSCKIGPSTTLIHKSIFEDIGYFDENLIVCEDYDLWLRVLLKYELGYINKPLIKKIAGDYAQLSFDTFAMDRFRITALEKHMNTKYKNDILKQIIQKLTYLVNGAKKRDNQDILNQYYPKLRYYEDLI